MPLNYSEGGCWCSSCSVGWGGPAGCPAGGAGLCQPGGPGGHVQCQRPCRRSPPCPHCLLTGHKAELWEQFTATVALPEQPAFPPTPPGTHIPPAPQTCEWRSRAGPLPLGALGLGSHLQALAPRAFRPLAQQEIQAGPAPAGLRGLRRPAQRRELHRLS